MSWGTASRTAVDCLIEAVELHNPGLRVFVNERIQNPTYIVYGAYGNTGDRYIAESVHIREGLSGIKIAMEHIASMYRQETGIGIREDEMPEKIRVF